MPTTTRRMNRTDGRLRTVSRREERGRNRKRPARASERPRARNTDHYAEAVPRGYQEQAVPQREREQIRLKAHALDMSMLFVILLLQAVGLIALFSASYSNGLYYHNSPVFFIKQQGMYAAAGLVIMAFVSKVPYEIYRYRLSRRALLLGSVALLILVAIPGVGTKVNGARRWLFGFQPSELAKLTVIICFAYWISENTKGIRTLKGLIKPYGFLLAVYIGLLYLEPHTSAMLIICGIGVMMLVAGGMRLWYFVPIIGVGAATVTLFYNKYTHVQERFAVWLDPFIDMMDTGFQGSMSQIAIGSGGLLGQGLGQGRQKHLYLPEPQNDFIFASWCEEMGFIGALLVIVLFGYLIYRGFKVARSVPDKFGCMLATGITIKLAIQTLLNLFVVTGIMPVTGAALPFFSYGGTALLMQLGEMGILLNISRYMRIDARTE